MSHQLQHTSLLALALPLLVIIGIILGVFITEIEGFEKLLLDKDPFAVAVVASAVGAVLYMLRLNVINFKD